MRLQALLSVSLDELFSQIADGVKTLNIIVKADVAGSAEAVKASLVKLSNEEILINLKRVDFINRVKEDLYRQASDKNEINYLYLKSDE